MITLKIILFTFLFFGVPMFIFVVLDEKGHSFLGGLIWLLYALLFIFLTFKCGSNRSTEIDDTTTDTTTEWKYENFSVEYNYCELQLRIFEEGRCRVNI